MGLGVPKRISTKVAKNGEVFPTTYRVGAAFMRFVGRFYFRVRYVDLDNVPETGGGILAANHVSFLDPPLIAGIVPRPMVFVANEMFFTMQPLGKWLRSGGGYPVNPEGDSAHSMKEVLRAIKSGRLLGLFPEGTRSWDGKPLPPMAGVGLLVAATDVPIIPIHVSGAYEAWPRHRKFPLPCRITIRFGKPIMLEDLRSKMTADRKNRRAHQQAIAEAVMDAIDALAPRRLEPSAPSN